jgi:hypothetical protein
MEGQVMERNSTIAQCLPLNTRFFLRWIMETAGRRAARGGTDERGATYE